MTDRPVEREPDTTKQNPFSNSTLEAEWSSPATAIDDPPKNGRAPLNGYGPHVDVAGGNGGEVPPSDEARREAEKRKADQEKATAWRQAQQNPRFAFESWLDKELGHGEHVDNAEGHFFSWPTGCPACGQGPVIAPLYGERQHCKSCQRNCLQLVWATIYGPPDEAESTATYLGDETPAGAPRRTSSPWPRAMGPVARQGLIGEAVDMIEPHTESDPHSVLISLLVAFGNVIGRGPGFMAEESFHATNLYAVIVGDSSKARKGTSWGHVNRLALLADPEYKSHIVGGLSSGEGIVWAVRDPVVKRVAVKEGKPAKPTGEYVDEVDDPGIDDKRLLVREGEFSRCLKVMSRQGNTLSATLRELWDDGSGGGLTKNEPTKCTQALVSILAHITRDELCRELTDTDAANGFGNRFLWSCARRSKLLPDGGSLPTADIEALSAKFGRAVEFARRLKVPLYRDDEARALWHEVYAELSEGQSALVGALTSRAEAQVMRLAVIYAVLDERTEVGVAHLRAALEVWRYCEESAAHVFGRATGDTTADEILVALRSSGADGMSRREVSALFSGHRSSERISAALEALEKAGQARMEKVSSGAAGGRPTERWYAT